MLTLEACSFSFRVHVRVRKRIRVHVHVRVRLSIRTVFVFVFGYHCSGCVLFGPCSVNAVFCSKTPNPERVFVFGERCSGPTLDKWSKKVISGPDFLKNDDIWSKFIKLDQIGSTLVSAS